MDKDIVMVLCVFAVLIAMALGLRNVSATDVHTYKLALTEDGCGYIQSLGLPVDQQAGRCSTRARFCPNRVGSGGSIILDNDKRVSVSEAMLLASQQWEVDLPPTAGMKTQLKWAWFWFSLAAVFGVAAFMVVGRGEGDVR